MFSGHEHNFQHSIADGINYFVSGAAGKLRKETPDRFDTARTRSWSDKCHFLLVEVRGSEMKVRAIGELGASPTLTDIPRASPQGAPVTNQSSSGCDRHARTFSGTVRTPNRIDEGSDRRPARACRARRPSARGKACADDSRTAIHIAVSAARLADAACRRPTRIAGAADRARGCRGAIARNEVSSARSSTTPRERRPSSAVRAP